MTTPDLPAPPADADDVELPVSDDSDVDDDGADATPDDSGDPSSADDEG